MVKVSPSDHWSVNIFIAGMACTFFGMLLWVWDFNTIRLGLIVLGLILYLFAGLVAIFFEGKLNKLSFLGKAGVFFYVFFYGYCILVNQLSDGFHEGYVPNFFWDSGFFFVGLGTLSFVDIGKAEMKKFIGFYLAFFVLDLVITAPYLNASVAFASGDRRDSFRQISEALGHAHKAYQLHVILSSMALISLAFAIEYIKEKKWILLSIGGVLGMLFLGLFYQKRNVFLELVIFTSFFVILPSLKITKAGVYLKVIGLAAVLALIGLYISNDLFSTGVNLVINRFTAGVEKTGPNERLAETLFFLDQFSTEYDWIGRGLTSYVPGTEGGNNLHMGMGNFILKGGYFMLVSVTLLLITNIIVSIKSFFLKGKKMQLWIQVFVLLAIYTYLSLWGWFPNIMYLPVALLIYDIDRSFNDKLIV